MANKGCLQIDMLGTSFTIQTDENSDYLHSLYTHYKNTVTQVEKNSGIADPLKLAIIAGILVSDELGKEKLRRQGQPEQPDLAEAEKLTMRMISRIDQVID